MPQTNDIILEQILKEFDESETARYHPVTLTAWEMTKDDIKSFISHAYSLGKEVGIKMAIDSVKEYQNTPTKHNGYEYGVHETVAFKEGRQFERERCEILIKEIIAKQEQVNGYQPYGEMTGDQEPQQRRIFFDGFVDGRNLMRIDLKYVLDKLKQTL